jgi:hypothetical protein
MDVNLLATNNTNLAICRHGQQRACSSASGIISRWWGGAAHSPGWQTGACGAITNVHTQCAARPNQATAQLRAVTAYPPTHLADHGRLELAQIPYCWHSKWQ